MNIVLDGVSVCKFFRSSIVHQNIRVVHISHRIYEKCVLCGGIIETPGICTTIYHNRSRSLTRWVSRVVPYSYGTLTLIKLTRTITNGNGFLTLILTTSIFTYSDRIT